MPNVDYAVRLRKGRRYLREMLPAMRAKVRKERKESPGSLTINPMTKLGQAVSQFITEENLDALIVYEDSPGRWYADLVLKNTPLGVADVLGTPVHMPHSSRKEAESQARNLLYAALLADIENKQARRDTKAEDVRYFDLHGIELPMPGEMIDQMGALAAITEQEFDVAALRSELSELLINASGSDDMTAQVWDGLTDAGRAKIMTKAAILMLTGHFRHPERIQEDS